VLALAQTATCTSALLYRFAFQAVTWQPVAAYVLGFPCGLMVGPALAATVLCFSQAAASDDLLTYINRLKLGGLQAGGQAPTSAAFCCRWL